MLRASLCPSSGEQEQDWLTLHVKMPVHTAYTTAPHTHSQHNQASSHEVLTSLVLVRGARGGVVFKALRYKPAGHVFDSRRCHWNFSVT
jgi:hypothetical protein